MANPLFETNIHSLPKLMSGKVRDIYAVGDDKLLIVATDRISAYDGIMPTPIPNKGKILVGISNWWFNKLSPIVPNHLTGIEPESVVSPDEVEQVKDRAIVVKRLKPIPIEAIVRGYLIGSAWKSYNASSIVGGQLLPHGLSLAEHLAAPIFTPTTKAPAGEHDEPIVFAEIEQRIGPEMAQHIREISLELYNAANSIAQTAGIIIADTKFEFGIDSAGQLVLMDEILTPDSSRLWPIEQYEVGTNPPSLDKQYLRDYLDKIGWDRQGEPPVLPDEIVEGLHSRYLEACRRLVHPAVNK